MLDKDNIISTSVSEAVEKIPTDEKDYDILHKIYTEIGATIGK